MSLSRNQTEILRSFKPNAFAKKIDLENYLFKWWESINNITEKNKKFINESPVKNKIVEQAWLNYTIICDLINKNKISSQQHTTLPDLLEKIDVIHSVYSEGLQQTRYIEFFANDLVKLLANLKQELDNEHIAKLQTTINLPRLTLHKLQNFISFEFGNSPLIIAISNTESKGALLLLKYHADANAYSLEFGNTPLFLAISKGWEHLDTSIIKEKHFAIIQSKLAQNENNLSEEEKFELAEFKKFKFEKIGNQIFAEQVDLSQQSIIRALLSNESTVDVNAPHLFNGMTALHIACLRGDDPELINLLIAKGAKLDAIDYLGRTPNDMLNFDYKFVQETIAALTGSKSFEGNKTHTATLPKMADWERNKQLIADIFSTLTNKSEEHDNSISNQKKYF